MKIGKWTFWGFVVVEVVSLLGTTWEYNIDVNHPLIVWFGRPSNVVSYTTQNWVKILEGCLFTMSISLISLLFSALLALVFLTIGLLSEKWLQIAERFAAVSQTVPILVIVTISFIIVNSVERIFAWDLGLGWYCFMPVGVALFFPPLVYGIKGIRDIDSNMKSLLRIWDAPQVWRIRKVYLPNALPHILTGLRASSTWAVVATLITEGLIYGVSENQYSIGKGLMRPFSGSVPRGQTPTLILVATILGLLVYYIIGVAQSIIQEKVYGKALKQEKKYPISG